MTFQMTEEAFSGLDLSDPFFDSLRSDYSEFDTWVRTKAVAKAYVLRNQRGRIEAFLHTKVEHGSVTDVVPELPNHTWLKIGTFKANAHGTRLGERLIKKVFDHAVRLNVDAIYTTVLPKHETLSSLLSRFGFAEVGVKVVGERREVVFARRLIQDVGTVVKNYPSIPSRLGQKYLLGIYPIYHTRLFPDSILQNESIENLDDVSHTNSILKAYICWMDLQGMRGGDSLIIYRTSDNQGPAWYRSVATSVCVVEEVRNRASFDGVEDYIKFCSAYSVFEEKELRGWWHNQRLQVIKMTYNAALLKRINRKNLIEDVGLDEGARWGVLPLSDSQFGKILKLGKVDERIIIN
jgi:hypothetical protein